MIIQLIMHKFNFVRIFALARPSPSAKHFFRIFFLISFIFFSLIIYLLSNLCLVSPPRHRKSQREVALDEKFIIL